MRASQWLLGLAVAGSVVGMVAAGCGGSSSNNEPADSGPDVTSDQGAPETGTPEAASDAGPADTGPAVCAVDADITMLNVPDAAIGDSGATEAKCYECIQTTCGSNLSACNADCTCKTDIATFIACLGSGMSVIACGTPLYSGGDQTSLGLLGCLAGPLIPGGSGPGCLKECGVSVPEGGVPTDSGTPDSGSKDAAGD